MSETINEYGRCVEDANTGKEIIVEYEDDSTPYVICVCGERARFESDIGTYKYKCDCGWESVCGVAYPDAFIGADRIKRAVDKSNRHTNYVDAK